MTDLADYLKSYFGMEEREIDIIRECFLPQTLRKHDYFLKAGQVCHTMSFQRSGLVRYYMDTPEKEVTQWISTPGYFITDLAGLVFDKPARYSIQALEDCELFSIDKRDYDRLAEKVPRWPQLERRFIARCFTYMEDRVFGLLSMTAEQRYKWLFDQHPAIFNQVPLQYLASMMGMTPETLSRIRKKQL
ncbi:cAMP-binding domain of CRP or a regulatory subunit of cAMP-dependent protein kinases [Chitinophaga jiangningensis]|uniref:cAMP-binding domain of CRP or a regulatory subunit of cAMP-dependent protein kinases n=1 Tax=Chitinophaga jiangningensis TaxID=1419482 RepID=A0A1M7ATV1_9BACT|nr:Crp/Fnr family transcriptional regulator [Chitinophaga jiangningensis]SHL46180.1 cAMP-binding domain of CRP or a regulatory subunit of cAMP-dependent protein kinases [Chitinophaga jiangningensis]